MYPENEPHLSSKGTSSDHPPAPAPPHSNADDSSKEVKDAPDKLPPTTTNSSTMTCPEWQYPNWPSHHMHPCPCPYRGMYCYQSPPPYFLNPTGCNCCLHAHCNKINTTPSGASVGPPNNSHSNTNSAQDNSDHNLTGNQSYYQTMPYPYPTLYTPNHMMLQNSVGFPFILAGGQMFPPNQMGNTRHVQSRNSLCCNCSQEIIPVVNDSNREDISGQSPLNITSFTDSVGRTWRCTDTNVRKAGKERPERVSLAGSCRYSNISESVTKRNTTRSRLASPSMDRPSTSFENSDFPQRKKKTKVRIRKAAEDVNVGPRMVRLPASRSLQSHSSNIIKPIRTLNCTCIDTGVAQKPTGHIKTNKKASKEKLTVSNVKSCKKNDSTEFLLQETSSKKPESASTEEQNQNQADLKQRAVREWSISDVKQSFTESSVTGPSTSSKLTKNDTTKDDKIINDIPDKASCNDFLKRSGIRKDKPSVQCSKEIKEDEFWLSSSTSSSGTYDDSEAFDSFKLLNDSGTNTETNRQNRECSRDRLFRRRVGLVKLANARSEEGLKKRSISPKPHDKDERSKEQENIDSGQARITEETSKMFIVESKDGASTSQKAMTITLQAEVPRTSTRDTCDFCTTEGQPADAGASCSSEVPPCQRPQWLAPPCPANEIHGTPIHHCHNMPPTGRMSQQQSSPQRHRHASRNEPNSGENSLSHDIEEYYRRMQRSSNLPNFGLAAPWNQRNVDRPREENRHPHYIPPRPSTERFDNIRRDHAGPTNRTRRWHTQSELPLAEVRGNRQADEMLRIQIPSSFSRYRPYEYTRNHNEEPTDNQEGMEENIENPNRNTIDINIFRSSGARRLGTIRRVIRCNSPRMRSHGAEETTNADDDPESNLDFYRRPRSAITVSKTNYFSPRNRKLEEEVQRIQSANYGHENPSASSVKDEEDEDSEYPIKNCDEDQEFEDGEKPDEYNQIKGSKRDQDRHRNIEDED